MTLYEKLAAGTSPEELKSHFDAELACAMERLKAEIAEKEAKLEAQRQEREKREVREKAVCELVDAIFKVADAYEIKDVYGLSTDDQDKLATEMFEAIEKTIGMLKNSDMDLDKTLKLLNWLTF